MIEIFKTNITNEQESLKIRLLILDIFPTSNIHFDLEDCDKILRIESENFLNEMIIKILNENNFQCEVLN